MYQKQLQIFPFRVERSSAVLRYLHSKSRLPIGKYKFSREKSATKIRCREILKEQYLFQTTKSFRKLKTLGGTGWNSFDTFYHVRRYGNSKSFPRSLAQRYCGFLKHSNNTTKEKVLSISSIIYQRR